jgi:hypothetical protein
VDALIRVERVVAGSMKAKKNDAKLGSQTYNGATATFSKHAGYRRTLSRVRIRRFAVLYGSPSIISFTSLLCVRAQLPVQLGGLGSDVVFVDGGNSFRLYQIAKLAQTHELGPKQVLDKIFISRAFTPYQLTTLLMQKLEGAIKQYNAKIVIISDITGLFSALQEYEGQRVLSQIATYLSNFARENNIIV